MGDVDVLFEGEVPGVFAEEVHNATGDSMPTRHTHETMELYFLLDGERYYFVAQDTYQIQAQMAILVNSNMIHKTSLVRPGQGYTRFLLQLDKQVLRPALLAMGLSADTIGEQFAGPALFSGEEWEQVMRCIELMQACLQQEDTASRQAQVWAISVLLLSFFLNARMKSAARVGPVRQPESRVEADMFRRVHEIAVYLENNCEKRIGLDELAAKYFVSKSYLTRIFRRITGFTVTEYKTYCRIQKAQLLLLATDTDITEIASHLGFGNITYFERVFKRANDVTPLQYRKQKRREKTGESLFTKQYKSVQ